MQLIVLWEKSKLKEIAVFYALSEVAAWTCSIVLVILEDLKRFPRSWMLNIFWILSILAGILKLMTRIIFAYVDSYYSWELGLQFLHGGFFFILMALISPNCKTKTKKDKDFDSEDFTIAKGPMILVTFTMVNG